MKTYLALFGLLFCASFRCLSQDDSDYLSSRQWVEERVGGTDRTPEKDRIFVGSRTQNEYAAIVQYRKGITIREVIDQTRFRNATLIVLVIRPNKTENVFFMHVAPLAKLDIAVRPTDMIWLIDISPPLLL